MAEVRDVVGGFSLLGGWVACGLLRDVATPL